MLDAADINKDGRLDYQEFCHALQAITYRQARVSEAQDGFRRPPSEFYANARAPMPKPSGYNNLASTTHNRAQSLLGDTKIVTSLLAQQPPLPRPLGGIARDRIRTKVLGSKAGLFGGFLNQAGFVVRRWC